MSDNLEPGRTDMFVPGPHDNAEPHEGVRESAPRVARSISNQPQPGACTGFDGGFEVGEAIRRLPDCVPTGKLNINADEQYALAA